MIERITEEEERASEAIANLAGRNGISFKPLSPSNNDIRTLEHEGLFFKHFKTFKKIRNSQQKSENFQKIGRYHEMATSLPESLANDHFLRPNRLTGPKEN